MSVIKGLLTFVLKPLLLRLLHLVQRLLYLSLCLLLPLGPSYTCWLGTQQILSNVASSLAGVKDIVFKSFYTLMHIMYSIYTNVSVTYYTTNFYTLYIVQLMFSVQTSNFYMYSNLTNNYRTLFSCDTCKDVTIIIVDTCWFFV